MTSIFYDEFYSKILKVAEDYMDYNGGGAGQSYSIYKYLQFKKLDLNNVIDEVCGSDISINRDYNFLDDLVDVLTDINDSYIYFSDYTISKIGKIGYLLDEIRGTICGMQDELEDIYNSDYFGDYLQSHFERGGMYHICNNIIIGIEESELEELDCLVRDLFDAINSNIYDEEYLEDEEG